MDSGGPLSGLKVIELAGLAPVPFTGTMLADFGADVLRVDRPDRVVPADRDGADAADPLGRGRRSVAVDLKHPDGATLVRRLAAIADVFLEGFRPGVCDRLGIGPDVCRAGNPGLIYARLTGWGASGPLAARAGHDIDYLALAGALAPLGPVGEPPLPPLNYVADFGGGGMLATVGVLLALVERERSGRGQVVDAAMVDGVGLLTAFVRGLRDTGCWTGGRESNPLAGAAPFYRTYRCADGRFVAVGAIEEQFYAALLAGLGLTDEPLPQQWEVAGWPELTDRIAAAFGREPRAEWERVFGTTDACVTPVLDLDEAPEHPHAVERGAFVDVDGRPQPAPAPRLDRTPGAITTPAPTPGRDTVAALRDWGLTEADVTDLLRTGAVVQTPSVDSTT